MVGANVTMLCSALMRNGINHLRHVERELREWMEEHEYESVAQMQGSMSQIRCPDPGAFERAQYTRRSKECSTSTRPDGGEHSGSSRTAGLRPTGQPGTAVPTSIGV
jgi:hypothetical protein